MRARIAQRSPQPPLRIRDQRIDQNRPGRRTDTAAVPVHPAATARGAQRNEIRGAVATAVVTARIHERLHQPGLKVVAPRPVHPQLPEAARQHRARQVLHRHPRQQQEAAVVDHALQIPHPSRLVPADPAVPRRHAPRRTRKLQAADHRTRGPRRKHQIAQVGPERNLVPQIVVAAHQLPEQQPPGRLAHQLELQRLNIAHTANQRAPRLARRRPRNAGHRPNRATAPLVRQHQRALGVEPLEELSALRAPSACRSDAATATARTPCAPAPSGSSPNTSRTTSRIQSQLPHAERASREPRRRHRVTGRRSRGACPCHDTVQERRANVQQRAGGSGRIKHQGGGGQAAWGTRRRRVDRPGGPPA